jgi:hypothetical protein
MVDRNLGTPGFDGFQRTSQQISQSVELANSQSGVDQRSLASQHPMTGTFGLQEFQTVHTLNILECQVSEITASVAKCHFPINDRD